VQVHISTGALVKEHLPSYRIEALVDGARQQLRAKQYGKALERLVVEVGLEATSKAHRRDDGGGGAGPSDDGLLFAGFGVLCGVVVCCGCCCGWGAQQTRSRITDELRGLQRDCQVRSARVSCLPVVI
jgi:hypothetical protein